MTRPFSTEKQLIRSLNMKYTLILEGLLVGFCAAVVSVLYRLVLDYAEKGTSNILNIAKGNWWIALLWFLVLILMGLFVGWLTKKEPMISGSGFLRSKGRWLGTLIRNGGKSSL